MKNKNVEFVVSGCLAGLNCKYNGKSNPCDFVINLVKQGKAIPICPESLSGLKIPRLPCEQKDGNVVTKDGKDITMKVELGAEKALARALESGARKAIIKSRSPSCGYGTIYDGTFTDKLTSGNGVWTQKLIDAGFEIFSEENLPDSVSSATLP